MGRKGDSPLVLDGRVAVFALLMLATTLAFASQAGRARAATIIFVDAAADGVDNGRSWADAYTGLQSAFATADPGDQVWVAGGTYYPTGGADRTKSFVLETGVAFYGGFAGGETSLGQRDPVGNLTVLSGDIGMVGVPADNSFHVVSGVAVGPSAVLDGFTVRDGRADGASPSDSGAGLYITSSSPRFANVAFVANVADAAGGGVYNHGGSPSFANVTFLANSADFGGGHFNLSGGPVLTNVTFSTNAAVTNGGGVYSVAGNPSLTNVTFVGNSAEFGGGFYNDFESSSLTNVTFSGNSATSGGGFFNLSGSPDLTNVTFSGNSATYGGGFFNSSGSATLTNATFTRNQAVVEGGAVYSSTGTLTLRESILWGNAPEQFHEDSSAPDAVVEHNVIQGGCPAETTCTPANVIDANPLLAALAANGGPTMTHALRAGSPAIDAGSPAVCAAVPTDQRMVTRPRDGNKDGTAKCDLGAYEFVPATPAVGFSAATSSAGESVTTVNIPVKLSTTAVGPVTVKYKIANGTAKSPSDYAAGTGTLTFAALTTTKNLTFTVTNDRFDEPNETIILTLSSPTGATLGTATHVRTVVDDDARASCRGRLPTIIGTAGNDTLVGRKGIDVIVGLGGNDTITGNGGDDVICGGRGDDTIAGGNGNDVVRGDAGNDKLTGDRGTDLVSGGGGKDQLAGNLSAGDFCDGGPAVDSLLPNHGCESTSSVP